MAVIKNISGETLSLFRPDAPPIDPGGEVTIRDEMFVGRAWPSDVWEIVTGPEVEGYVETPTADAAVWQTEADSAAALAETPDRDPEPSPKAAARNKPKRPNAAPTEV